MLGDYDRIYALQDRTLDVTFSVSPIWYLTGGTALSRFYTHHRFSDDLDFFTQETVIFSEVYRLTYAALARAFSGLQSDVDAKDFKRIVIREDELTLKLDFVSDTTVRRDVPIVHGTWKIDSVRNIASNKICAVISRDEPRDVADILAICRRYSFRWDTLIEEAQGKAAFTREELVYRCRAFPGQLLDTVPFTEQRDPRRDTADWVTVCDDIRNTTDNRVASPSAEPLIP